MADSTHRPSKKAAVASEPGAIRRESRKSSRVDYLADQAAHRRDSSDPSTTSTGRKTSVYNRDSSMPAPDSFRRPSRKESVVQHVGQLERRISRYRRPSNAGSRSTSTTYPPVKPQVRYENTYHTEPKDGEKFNADLVQRELIQMLQFLEGEEYAPKQCVELAKNLSDKIRDRMKLLPFSRYKFVCMLMIGQVADQGLLCASRCIWDAATDGHASATYKNSSLFAVATVYATFYEGSDKPYGQPVPRGGHFETGDAPRVPQVVQYVGSDVPRWPTAQRTVDSED